MQSKQSATLKGNKNEAQVELFFFPNSLHHTTVLCNIVKFLFFSMKK